MKIAVAMSGGVDSTVAALLLRAQGHSLIGVFMHNWDELNERDQCSSEEDYKIVQDICFKLAIPCRRVDFVKEYWNDVFSNFLEGMSEGLTLNPDILCNQKIKFGTLFRYITQTMGVSRIATGHYARIRQMQDGSVKLLQAVDKFKDQTYFLSLVSQSALQQTFFPIGHMTKEAVKKVAHGSGFRKVAECRESYGLCFVGKRKFSKFISDYLEEQDGHFISTEGKILGRHKGHHLYTIGQRARLGGHSHPYYVIAKCPRDNLVTIAKGSTHPALYTSSFLATPPHWIHDVHHTPKQCHIKTNYYQKEMVQATLLLNESGLLEVNTALPLRAVTPGQYAVFYSEEECLGASCIINSRKDS